MLINILIDAGLNLLLNRTQLSLEEGRAKQYFPTSAYVLLLLSSAQDPAPAGLSLALFPAFPHPPPPGQVVK
jgi:hypothetical protein